MLPAGQKARLPESYGIHPGSRFKKRGMLLPAAFGARLPGIGIYISFHRPVIVVVAIPARAMMGSYIGAVTAVISLYLGSRMVCAAMPSGCGGSYESQSKNSGSCQQ